jgi:hypothetical protein
LTVCRSWCSRTPLCFWIAWTESLSVIHPLKGTNSASCLELYILSHSSAMSARRPSDASADVQHFIGYVETTTDALRLIMAARLGIIPRITRRLNDSERRSMIRSGAVFVFCVEESSIRRWTEGLSWSPSRIVSNFLVCHSIPPQSWLRFTKPLFPRCTARSASGIPIGEQTRRSCPSAPRNVDLSHRTAKLSSWPALSREIKCRRCQRP